MRNIRHLPVEGGPFDEDVEESLHKEISVFQTEKALVDSRLGKTPEILIQNETEVYDHVEIDNEAPKLSIISCSLNLGRFLEETVLSVTRQSFRDYEHIVIDAGSTDETIEILKRYPHIKWISEKDSGYLEGFRKGLAMAKGKYVMQCAVSDGYLDTSWFQRCVDVLDSDQEVSLVWGFPQYLTEDSKLGDISYPQFHHSPPPQKDEWFAYWLRTGFWLPEGNFCVRKEVFEKCFPTNKEGSEDLEPYLEFNYFFDSLGYLPYHIPIVANFGRTHKNQLGQRESESGVGQRKLEMYLRKVQHHRWKVVTGKVIHVFRDGAHMPIPIKPPIEQIRRDYFNSSKHSHLLSAVKKSRLLSPVRVLYSYYRHFRCRWMEPILPRERIRRSISLYKNFVSDWSIYKKTPGSEPLRFLDSYPCLFDRTAKTYFDAHYFYQGIWAFKLIKQSGTLTHVDVGSLVDFVGLLTAITRVTFVDIRPLRVDLENFESKPGSILALPFDDNSVTSLSCLHVAEHIGLGRYGDHLDPQGTKKAARELARVLTPRGNLYFSIPIGKPRVCFNAHRIHSPEQILCYFHDLKLVEFAAVTDAGTYTKDIKPGDLVGADYACGLFRFTKEL